MEARKLSKSHPPPYELSLRIRHPSIDPADLSRELGLAVKHSFRAGEPRQSYGGVTFASVYGESYWLGTLDPASWPAANWFSESPNLRLDQQELDKTVTRSLGWALLLSATSDRAPVASRRQRLR